MSFKVIPQSSPEEEPITLAQAKAQLRVEHDDEDDYICSLISSARDSVEKHCNRFFSAREVLIFVEKAKERLIDLRVPNVDSIISINYFIDGVETLIDSADYSLLSFRSEVYSQNFWPASELGYNILVTVAPPPSFEAVKIAMLMMIADLYELRTESVLGVSVSKNPAVMALLSLYRVDMGI
jgi:uncharacterized phiE125 gp8 family phage protein